MTDTTHKLSTRLGGAVQLLQFQGTTRSCEIFVEFGPPTGRQLSFSRGITSEKAEPCTEPRRTSCLRTDARALVYGLCAFR